MSSLLVRRLGSWRLVGLDPDPEELRLASRTSAYERVICATGDNVPEADGSFDFAFANSVLEHIPEPIPVLKEMCRVLKQNGSIVITVPSSDLHDCLRGPSVALRWIFPARRGAYLEEFDRRLAHAFYWSDDRWAEVLGRLGVEVALIADYFSEPAVQRFELIANLTSGILFRLFQGKSRPIEIQRRLGLRRSDVRLPRLVSAALAATTLTGLERRENEAMLYGCRLIIGTKRASSA